MNVYNLAKCLAVVSGINLMGFAIGMESDPPLSCGNQKGGQNNSEKTTIVFDRTDGKLEIDCYSNKDKETPSDNVEEDKQESDKVKKNKQKVRLENYYILNLLQYAGSGNDFSNIALVNKKYGKIIRSVKAVRATALKYEERVNAEIFLSCTQLLDIIEGKKRITRYIPGYRDIENDGNCEWLYLDGLSYIFQSELVSYIWPNDSEKIIPMNSVESIVLKWDPNFILDIMDDIEEYELDDPDWEEVYLPIHETVLIGSPTAISFLNILAIIRKYFPQTKTIVLDGFENDDRKTIKSYIYDKGFIKVFKALEDECKTILDVLKIAKNYFPDISLNSKKSEAEIISIWNNNGKKEVVNGVEVKTIDNITLDVFFKTIQELKKRYKAIMLKEDLIKFEVLYNAYTMLYRLSRTANKTAEKGEELKLTYRTIRGCMLDDVMISYKYSFGSKEKKNPLSKKRIIQFKTNGWRFADTWASYHWEINAADGVIEGAELGQNAGSEEDSEHRKMLKRFVDDLKFDKRYVKEKGFFDNCCLREKYLSFKGYNIKTLFNQLKDQALRSAISLHPDSCKRYFNLVFFDLFTKKKKRKVVYNYVDFGEKRPSRIYNQVLDFCVNKIILIYFQKDDYLDLKMEYKNYPTGRYYQDNEKAANNSLIELQEKIKKRYYQNDEKTTKYGLIKLQKKILERGYEDLFDKVFKKIKNDVEKYDNLIQQIVDKILQNKDVNVDLKQLYNAILSEDSCYTCCISRAVLNGGSFSVHSTNYPAINPATEDKYNIVTGQPRAGMTVFLNNNSNNPCSYPNLVNKGMNFTPKIKVLWDILELQTTCEFVGKIFGMADELIDAVLERKVPALQEVVELIILSGRIEEDFTSFERVSIYDFVQFARAVIIAKAVAINREIGKYVYNITALKQHIDHYFGFSNNTDDNPYHTPDINRLLFLVDQDIGHNIFLTGDEITRLIEQLAYFVLKFMFLNKEKAAKIYCELEVDDD